MDGDLIDTLKTDDKSQLTYKEKTMIDALYPTENIEKLEQTIEAFPKHSKKIWLSFREIIISTILFVIFNLPFMDTLIGKLTKSENPTYRLAAKTALFTVSFFVLTNFSLARV
jgi:hypothetical protein